MIRLNKKEYELARPVFRQLKYNLSIDAVLDGTCPGMVFVNDREAPTVSLLVTHEGWYLEGETDEDFIASLKENLDEIIEHQERVHEYTYSWHYYPEKWKSVLQEILAERLPMEELRRFYQFKEMNMDWRERIANEVEMRHIDDEILGRTELDNHDEVESWVRANWGTAENFMEKGFGVVLIHGDVIVSWSLADGVSGDRCEIGIHTDDEHRKKGLGAAATAANVEYAQTQGFQRIGWHCGESNIGSIKTAERVGFELVRKYHVFEGWFTPFDQYLELGWYYYRKGDYRQSAEYYEKCFALGEADFPEEKFWVGASGETLAKSFFYYNCACAWALAEEKENALKNLNLAMDWGWTHFEHLKRDDDLKSLHNEKAWKEILARMEDSLYPPNKTW